MYWTYILKLNNKAYYVGSTNNLTQRLEYHRKGRVYSTKNKLPFVLSFSKKFNTRGEAQSLEYKVKKCKSSRAIERLINTGPIV